MRRSLVEESLWPALGARSVVRQDHDDRVVKDLELGQEVQQAPDLGVRVGEEARVHLHLPCEHAAFVGGEVVPGRDPDGSLR
jgi:hypothetical protein